MSSAVVLVVDKYSLGVHLATQTAGVKYPVYYDRTSQTIFYTKEFYSILADLANVRAGTQVFFYKRRIDEPPEERGFLGVWEADVLPNTTIVAYEDLSNALSSGGQQILACCPVCKAPVAKLEEGKPKCGVCGADLNGFHILPLRFRFKQSHRYAHYLDDNTAYIDLTDHGRLSTLIFRKIYGAGRERSVNPVLPEEAEKLRRLLQRVQQHKQNAQIPNPPLLSLASIQGVRSIFDYLDMSRAYPLMRGRNCAHSLLYNVDGELVFETILEFWVVHELVSQPSKLLQALQVPPGESVEWFANQVLFGIGGEKSDVLILTRDSEGRRCRAVVIELKKGVIDTNACQQTKKYAYWIAQLVTSNMEVVHPFKITPILIGHRKARNLQVFSPYTLVIPYSTPLQVQVESPCIYCYKVDTANNTLNLL